MSRFQHQAMSAGMSIDAWGMSPSRFRYTPAPILGSVSPALSQMASQYLSSPNGPLGMDPFGPSMTQTQRDALVAKQNMVAKMQENAFALDQQLMATRVSQFTGGNYTDAQFAHLREQTGLVTEFLHSAGQTPMGMQAMQRFGNVLSPLMPQMYVNQGIARTASTIHASPGQSKSEILKGLSSDINSRIVRGEGDELDPEDRIRLDSRRLMGFTPQDYVSNLNRLSAQGYIDLGGGREQRREALGRNEEVLATMSMARDITGLRGASSGQLYSAVNQLTGGGVMQSGDSSQVANNIQKIKQVQESAQMSFEAMMGMINKAKEWGRQIGVQSNVSAQIGIDSMIAGQSAAQGFNQDFGATPGLNTNARDLTALAQNSRFRFAKSDFAGRAAVALDAIRSSRGGLQSLKDSDDPMAQALLRASEGDLRAEDIRLLRNNDQGVAEFISDRAGYTEATAMRLINSDLSRQKALARNPSIVSGTNAAQAQIIDMLDRSGLTQRLTERFGEDTSVKEMTKLTALAVTGNGDRFRSMYRDLSGGNVDSEEVDRLFGELQQRGTRGRIGQFAPLVLARDEIDRRFQQAMDKSQGIFKEIEDGERKSFVQKALSLAIGDEDETSIKGIGDLISGSDKALSSFAKAIEGLDKGSDQRSKLQEQLQDSEKRKQFKKAFGISEDTDISSVSKLADALKSESDGGADKPVAILKKIHKELESRNEATEDKSTKEVMSRLINLIENFDEITINLKDDRAEIETPGASANTDKANS